MLWRERDIGARGERQRWQLIQLWWPYRHRTQLFVSATIIWCIATDFVCCHFSSTPEWCRDAPVAAAPLHIPPPPRVTVSTPAYRSGRSTARSPDHLTAACSPRGPSDRQPAPGWRRSFLRRSVHPSVHRLEMRRRSNSLSVIDLPRRAKTGFRLIEHGLLDIRIVFLREAHADACSPGLRRRRSSDGGGGGSGDGAVVADFGRCGGLGRSRVAARDDSVWASRNWVGNVALMQQFLWFRLVGLLCSRVGRSLLRRSLIIFILTFRRSR